jgi:hypothetical protein
MKDTKLDRSDKVILVFLVLVVLYFGAQIFRFYLDDSQSKNENAFVLCLKHCVHDGEEYFCWVSEWGGTILYTCRDPEMMR